jgi:hypothetical protein
VARPVFEIGLKFQRLFPIFEGKESDAFPGFEFICVNGFAVIMLDQSALNILRGESDIMI